MCIANNKIEKSALNIDTPQYNLTYLRENNMYLSIWVNSDKKELDKKLAFQVN